jgi:hypothetical protein
MDWGPHDGHPEPRTRPAWRVFAVLVREETPDVGDVIGSIEKWNWIREDSVDTHAPVDWEERYAKELCGVGNYDATSRT